MHALDEHGMIICNPRDKEAALRAQTEGIATYDWKMITCYKCLSLVYRHNKAASQQSNSN